ncbi:nucleolar protein 12-like [Uloborus diversus]|uniref:nucleolar protein 12-like n=1 Tax=Uloborus diversus TaxID=327109 RepID=UPI002409752B|nr:nucleolar protein 12-like [Uloborus diversus]
MKTKKKIKKSKVHLVFDEKDRVNFLTGFAKRKMERKMKAKQKLESRLKEEKKRIMQSQKEALREAIMNQRGVPEIEHLLNPVTYDLPNHTVTISEIETQTVMPLISTSKATSEELPTVPKTKKKVDEVEKIRKLIKDLKTKRINALKKSSTQFSVKMLQKKKDRIKAKRMRKQMEKSLKGAKKKHKKKEK